ncbi:MAG TPA: type II toxin-antitoxin system VapC family toxin, partial [Candidatus Lustribacter sp.]|nr:type II toxin-antitoxin system VapC family toxin [Candidatus Lustribacter sp.]
MRYLLDTHTLLWALTDPASLGDGAAQVVRDADQTLVVSAASAWEIATKQRLGRLPHADAIVATYARHLRRLGAEPLPITDEHALLAGDLDWGHRDPFDRILAAQAMVELLT